MRKYSNTQTEEKHFFSCVLVFFFLVSERTEQTTRKRKKERSNEREREREREKKRHEKELRPRESFNQKHRNHKSTTFCSGEKKTQKKTLSLNTSNGEPRSGGNLERVTREKRERGAFLIVRVVVFSLFSFSLIKEARAKSAKDSIPFRSDSLSEEGVRGSNPKHYKARRIFLSL